MGDEPDKEYARQILESLGFAVEDIPVAPDAERADLRATCAGEVHVIEVKGKDVTDAYRQMDAEARANGFADGPPRSPAPSNRLAGIVRKARDQLVATPADAGTFHVLWASFLHGDGKFVRDCFRDTLYGLQWLAGRDQNDEAFDSWKHCFYYYRNAFYRFPEIDGAALVLNGELQVCINEFSPRYEAFRRSRLASMTAAIDPPELERTQEIPTISIRGDVDRTDQKARWQYIRDTYGYQTVPVPMQHYEGLAIVDFGDLADS